MSDSINDMDQTTRGGMDMPILGGPMAGDRTVIADRTVLADRTIVADKTVAYSAQQNAGNPVDNTLRIDGQKPVDNAPVEHAGQVFTLKGEQYWLVRSLSENSGEAQVFLVNHGGKEYVLKVYYPNYDINKKLMRRIYSFQFEMVVKLYDFGKMYVDGKHRCYELMEYLQGGTLQEYHLDGDFNKFRRITLQAAAALDYCHRNSILHKDIKPANYFFRDKDHSQLVLGDFGISVLMEKDAKVYRTTQARTPIFAAPEMYTDVIDGEVEITAAADFYSLGITLFALWLGENPMSSNERLMMRQKNEGRLPRLDELPAQVRQLIQGLTVVNYEKRWKYDEVERWFLGENVPVDVSSPYLRYRTFIVDPDKNLIADNLHDLVPLLVKNESLAVNYLYDGRIATWLENCGNTKLALALKDIVSNRYPVDHKAGLMAAIYAMEPSYPYYDVQDEPCDDVHGIALSLISNKERYALDLQNVNDRLFIWLESHTDVDVKRIQSYFTPDANPHVAVMRTVYEIDPDVPLLAKYPSATIGEIVKSFGSIEVTEEDEWHSLLDGRLLSWMYSHEDVMACEALRIMTQDQPYSLSLAYKVLYNIDRSAAYDLQSACTQAQIGEYLSKLLQSQQHTPNNELAVVMGDFVDLDGRFNYYAQLHGWHQEIADAASCFDMNATENVERLSAYDMHTALYRFCRILGATPVYLLPDGTELRSPNDMEDKQLANVIRGELRTGALHQWLSVFYHEDPTRDFAEEYSYEHELENWVVALGRYDVQQLYYKRYMKAKEDTSERISEVRHDWNYAHYREKIFRYIFYGFASVWMLLILIFGIENHNLLIDHPNLTILLPLGGMTGIIVATRSYFGGFGPFLSFLFGLIGIFTAYIPIWVLKFVESWQPSLFSVAIIVLSLIYVVVCYFTDFKKDDQGNSAMIQEILNSEDINTSLLEPLYYTFKTKSHRYKSSKFGLLDDISNQVSSISGETVIHYLLWSLVFIVLILEFCVLSPRLMGKSGVFFGEEYQSAVVEQQNSAD